MGGIVGLLGPGLSYAADFSREEAAVQAHVADRLGVDLSDVEVKSLGLHQPLNCDQAATISASSRSSEDFKGHADIRLTGIDAGGECGSVRIRAAVKVWLTVPVTKAATLAGNPVEIESARMSIDQIHGVPVPLSSGPWEARVSMARLLWRRGCAPGARCTQWCNGDVGVRSWRLEGYSAGTSA